ncbi:MAG TPA: FAD-binding protein [Candidatus Thermoplasmatota archaeon]|nr:FAD-binding protein [Candidatus Thermoplasmatota archaeon]
MAIKARDLEQLAARVGRDNVLAGEADRLVYSTDIGAPPAIVDLLVKRKADAVVRCRTIEDVETTVQFCLKRRIPITPRAAATNALGGAVPKRKGIVIDLTPMDSFLAIDEKSLTVTVDAGVVVWDLQRRLNDVGLELPCYPTSALAATIGGFVAMDGHGIHSTRSGSIGKSVLEVEGVNPDGTRFHLRDQDGRSFLVGLGGSTGIITRIKLKVVEASPDKPVLLTVKDEKAVQAAIQEATQKWKVKHAMFHNEDFFALRAEATGARKNPFAGKCAVLLVFKEADLNAAKPDLERMATRLGGALADEKAAVEEWAARFYPIRAKKLGPSLVAGEVFVPVAKLAAYLRKLRAKVSVKELSVEGHVTDDGRVYFFIFALDDERRPNYPLGWGTSAWILGLAKRMGGNAYHPGVWLQWEAKSCFGASRYRQLKVYKRQADYRNIMNPGMVFPLPAPIPEFVYKMQVKGPTPAPSLGWQLAAGNPVLRTVGGAMKYRRHKSLGVKAADVAADIARGQDLAVLSDDIWGADLVSLQAIPNPGRLPMTQTMRGKMVLAQAYVRSRIVDPWSLKPALDVADPAPLEAAVAPDYEKVTKVMDSFRRAVATEGVVLTVKAVEVKAVAKADAGHDVAKVATKTIDVAAIKKQAAETPEPKKAWVLAADCIVCNGCEVACPTNAAIVTDIARVDRDLCIADGACFDACPTGAIRPGLEDNATTAGWPAGSRLAGKMGKPLA